VTSAIRRHLAISRAVVALLLAVIAVPASAQQDRSFRLGFTPLPPVYSNFGRGIVYNYISAAADLVSHTLQDGVPWNEALLSSDWRTYPSSLRSKWSELAAYDSYFIPNHARYVSIHPINYAYDGLAEYWGEQPAMPLPAPWSSLRFNNSFVKLAYLNYAIATVEFFHPAYLGLGVESNILLARAPQVWGDYKELNAFVYTELKRRYPDLVIFSSVQYEHMLGLLHDSNSLLQQVGAWWPTVLEDEVASLMHHSDLLVLSTYPYMAYGAQQNRAHYDKALAMSARTGRRIAIEQTGATSESIQIYYSTLIGTEALQSAFVSMLLDLAASEHFAFVVNFVAIDYGQNYGTDAVAMTWAYTGLFRLDGSTKPAATIWLEHLARHLTASPAQ
jgi:hypothetical protein